jgi:hypothetical protein
MIPWYHSYLYARMGSDLDDHMELHFVSILSMTAWEVVDFDLARMLLSKLYGPTRTNYCTSFYR